MSTDTNEYRKDWTCTKWHEALLKWRRPSQDGKEIQIQRNDAGIVVYICEADSVGAFAPLATFRTINEAYSFTSCYLARHPETGFSYV